jgi:hypothetical protein
MPGELESAMTESFGSVDEFKVAILRRGCGQFGSGWCWLVKDSDGVAQGHQDRERREPALLRSDRAAGLRRVGAFLLHRLPQQAPGLPDELPRQAGELGKRRLAVAIGAVVLREGWAGGRASPWRWRSIAVLVLTLGLGAPPWISLTLATTFGVYGLLKRWVAAGPVVSVTSEVSAVPAARLGLPRSGWPRTGG